LQTSPFKVAVLCFLTVLITKIIAGMVVKMNLFSYLGYPTSEKASNNIGINNNII